MDLAFIVLRKEKITCLSRLKIPSRTELLNLPVIIYGGLFVGVSVLWHYYCTCLVVHKLVFFRVFLKRLVLIAWRKSMSDLQ